MSDSHSPSVPPLTAEASTSESLDLSSSPTVPANVPRQNEPCVYPPYLYQLVSGLPSLVWPVTSRKLWCWFTYTMIALLIWGDGFDIPSLWDSLEHVVEWNSTAFALFLMLVDPALISLAMLGTYYGNAREDIPSSLAGTTLPMDTRFPSSGSDKTPPSVSNNGTLCEDGANEGADTTDTVDRSTPPLQLDAREDRVAVVIPTHNSADIIRPTVASCLRHVHGNQVFICDNNDNATPTDSTFAAVHHVEPTVNYHYNAVGNKTRAQFMGATSKENHFPYTMLMDDDVVLPPHFAFELDRFDRDPNLQCLVYPISATTAAGALDPTTPLPLLVEWQDLEYKLSGLVKHLQSNVASVVSPHGSISVWRTPILKRLLVEQDTVFYGDDTKMGLYLLQRGFRSEFVQGTTVATIAPTTLLGPLPNLYHQRVCSWDATEHLLTGRFLDAFARSYVRGSAVRTVGLRFFEVKILLDIVGDWLKVMVLVYFAHEPHFWAWLGLAVAANVGTTLLWNYGKCWNRPDLRCSARCVATFWAYKTLTSVFRILGLLRCYLFYIPNFVTPVPIALEDDTQTKATTPWSWSVHHRFFEAWRPSTDMSNADRGSLTPVAAV